MRRALLMTGIAAGTAILFTVGLLTSPNKDEKLKQHMDKVRAIALCQKGYEIASSFPSYASRNVQDVDLKIALVNRADSLEAKSKELELLLTEDFKQEAKDLGLDSITYDAQLASIISEAEVQAVMAFQQTEEPLEVLSQLDEVCQSITE
jgi:gas vesicle protein